jgi:TRAP-type uncharacterized transport system fused permease subunit
LTPTFAVAWALVGAILTSFIREDSSILPRRAFIALVGVFAALLALGQVWAGLDIALDVRGITFAALLAVIVVAFVDFLRTSARGLEPSKLNEALSSGSKQILNVSVTTAAAGLIIGIVTLTGLGLKFSDLVVGLGGGQLLPTLFFAALSVWVLGLALPITASYIIAAVIVAPALERLGVPLFAAHMFIFYYAVLSEVSPPVGLSPLAASAITGANFYRAMMQTWRYTLPVFVVPFMFSLGENGKALLLQAAPLEVVIAVTTAVIGLTALVSGAGGWFTRIIPLWIRGLFILAGGLLIYAGTLQDLIGVTVFMVAALCSVTLVRAPRPAN